MADLDMPQRQTFPAIRGSVADEVGLLPLANADELLLLLEVEGGDLFELPATALDPTETFIVDGDEYEANFEAPVAAGLSDDINVLRGKLKITWTAGQIQYAPKSGFITVEITENVTEAP